MNFRPVGYATGILVALLGLAMVPCALLDFAASDDRGFYFLFCAALLLLLGSATALLTYTKDMRVGHRDAFVLTVGVWLIIPLVAAIPILFFGYSFTDAYFEAMSGLTTTGSTIMTGLDDMPRGLLLWRGIMQWIGGIGIIVTALAVLPMLGVGGMQIFQVESSDISGKFLPRIRDIAVVIGLAYLFLSASCAFLYGLSGMSTFDAVIHTMSTMSCGGFSTHDASFGYFNDTWAPWVSIVFMLLAAMPFSLLALFMIHARPVPLLKDSQPQLLLAIVGVFAAVIFLYTLMTLPGDGAPLVPFRDVLFNTVSVVTGTGYANAPYDTWGSVPLIIFLIGTFLGGCAGSAACGVKMFRLEITWKAVTGYATQMVRPNRLVVTRLNGRRVTDDVLQSVIVFTVLYMGTFIIASVLLSLTGLDALTALSTAATTVSNVGPGLGPITGPSTTFQSLTDSAKWICVFAMLLGRLEFVPVFVIMTRRFWS